jgi:hypothetical protein
MVKKQYYTQFVNHNDEQIPSTEVGVESKLFVTVVDKSAEMSDIQTQIETKLKNLSFKFELKKEYETSNGNRGLFYVVPDIF